MEALLKMIFVRSKYIINDYLTGQIIQTQLFKWWSFSVSIPVGFSTTSNNFKTRQHPCPKCEAYWCWKTCDTQLVHPAFPVQFFSPFPSTEDTRDSSRSNRTDQSDERTRIFQIWKTRIVNASKGNTVVCIGLWCIWGAFWESTETGLTEAQLEKRRESRGNVALCCHELKRKSWIQPSFCITFKYYTTKNDWPGNSFDWDKWDSFACPLELFFRAAMQFATNMHPQREK